MATADVKEGFAWIAAAVEPTASVTGILARTVVRVHSLGFDYIVAIIEGSTTVAVGITAAEVVAEDNCKELATSILIVGCIAVRAGKSAALAVKRRGSTNRAIDDRTDRRGHVVDHLPSHQAAA